MNIIYNIAADTANGFLKLYSRCISRDCRRKFPMFALAQQGLLDQIQAEMGRPVGQAACVVSLRVDG